MKTTCRTDSLEYVVRTSLKNVSCGYESVHFDFSFDYGEIVSLDYYNVNNNP